MMGKVGIEGWWHAWFHAWLHACGQEVGMKNVVQREKGNDGYVKVWREEE